MATAKTGQQSRSLELSVEARGIVYRIPAWEGVKGLEVYFAEEDVELYYKLGDAGLKAADVLLPSPARISIKLVSDLDLPSVFRFEIDGREFKIESPAGAGVMDILSLLAAELDERKVGDCFLCAQVAGDQLELEKCFKKERMIPFGSFDARVEAGPAGIWFEETVKRSDRFLTPKNLHVISTEGRPFIAFRSAGGRAVVMIQDYKVAPLPIV